jgi:hypothetical protein
MSIDGGLMLAQWLPQVVDGTNVPGIAADSRM